MKDYNNISGIHLQFVCLSPTNLILSNKVELKLKSIQ